MDGITTGTVGNWMELVVKYGLNNVLIVAIFLLFSGLIFYILRTSDKREMRLSNILTTHMAGIVTGQQSLTNSIQNLVSLTQETQRLGQARYDSMMSANTYQREEHTKMMGRFDNLDQRIGVVHVDVKDRDCKANQGQK